MNEKTRWASNLTDEQRAALDETLVFLNILYSNHQTQAALTLRAAFAAKPRERVGWIDERTFYGEQGSGVYDFNGVGSMKRVRVRVTEILGDDEAQS